MPQPLTHLGDMPIEEFIRDYWQQKPLLIRQAFEDFSSPIDADELAGLALEEEIESRLILEEGAQPWELRCGPFSEEDFAGLPKDKWTLLVQAVDHYIPEVADILDFFRFIPSWRLDDIMISYAVDGGSVGPHFDQYDVFLLQAEGQRQWQLGQMCDQASPRLSGVDLDILKNFDAGDSWLLNPGDMLYIPPQLAHWGTAIGDGCMTYSMGFRAPSHAELLNDFTQERMSLLSEEQRYADAAFTAQDNPGLISDEAINRVTEILTQQLSDPNQIKHWFAGLVTQPKYSEEAHQSADPEAISEQMEEFKSQLNNENLFLERNPASRFAYLEIGNGEAELFIDGQRWSCELSLAEALCGQKNTEISSSISNQSLLILSELFITEKLY